MTVMLGLLFLVSKRQYCPVDKLHRIVGVMFILIAVHLLFLNHDSFFGESADIVFQYGLVLIDLVFCIYCIILISRSLHKHQNGAAPSVTDSPVETAQPVETTAEQIPEALAEQDTDEAVTENGDDPEAVEQLENPNVDDFLFFQKVEALMVNELLFCEQELSREALATAIGTNRTYLARSIKSATGKTFSEYITDLRTAYAAKLLTTTDEPLDLIGTLVGFRSKSSYYRAFSAAFNCTPSEYRKNSVCLRTLETEGL